MIYLTFVIRLFAVYRAQYYLAAADGSKIADR
jgi:hypothetical protein